MQRSLFPSPPRGDALPHAPYFRGNGDSRARRHLALHCDRTRRRRAEFGSCSSKTAARLPEADSREAGMDCRFEAYLGGVYHPWAYYVKPTPPGSHPMATIRVRGPKTGPLPVVVSWMERWTSFRLAHVVCQPEAALHTSHPRLRLQGSPCRPAPLLRQSGCRALVSRADIGLSVLSHNNRRSELSTLVESSSSIFIAEAHVERVGVLHLHHPLAPGRSARGAGVVPG